MPGIAAALVSAVCAAAVTLTPGMSHAAIFRLDFGPFDPTSVLVFAITSGVISFALLSAFWLIRERQRIAEENLRLKNRFADLRASHERLDALVNIPDQRIVVWDSGNSGHVLGQLDESSGAPADPLRFLAFGRWLSPASAPELEKAIELLRGSAHQFTLALKTINGTAIEAQGRVSGSHAFVRFLLLEGAHETIARLKQKQQGLSDRFALMEAMFETLPAPFWIRDAEGRLLYANPAYADAVEAASIEEAVQQNKSLFDARERGMIEKACEAGGKFSGELPAVVAGDRRKLETLEVRTGSGYAGIAIDRSDADAVRARLKQAILSHEQTFDHLAAAVAIFDEKQRLQFHNASFQKLWGFGENELADNPSNGEILELLRSLKKLPETADWRRWRQSQLDVYRSTETHEEYWHLPDGRTLRVVVNPQSQGGVSWVFENLTEELELKSSYNALIRVQGETLDHLTEAVAVFGSDGKLRLTNPAFQKMWGFESGDRLEDRHVRDIAGKITDCLADPAAWEAIHYGITGMEEGRSDHEGRIELRQGTILDYRLVRLPDGQTMLNLVDVTASVNVERALKDRNDALEESDALKSRFIRHVSYELRAPLTSIAGFAEILASDIPGKLNSKQAEYLGYITRSSDVLRALIDDILDLASIDAGAMELELSRVDINLAIDESMEALHDKLGRHKISVRRDLARNAVEFIADQSRIRQILYNLISNAANASPDGGEIVIGSRISANMLELSVADSGTGIPAAMADSIFERFEAGIAKDRRRGAGLGLSIVKSFTELHGGNVRVESRNGKGARFICEFPVDMEAGRQAAE